MRWTVWIAIGAYIVITVNSKPFKKLSSSGRKELSDLIKYVKENSTNEKMDRLGRSFGILGAVSPSKEDFFKERERNAMIRFLVEEAVSIGMTLLWYSIIQGVFKAIGNGINSIAMKLLDNMDSHQTQNNLSSNITTILKPNVTLNSYEIEVLNSITFPDSKISNMDSIGGLKMVKETITASVCIPSLFNDITRGKLPEVSKPFLTQPVNSILLFGPPGCGKTSLARAISTYMRLPMIHVTPSLLLRKWVGDTSQMTKAIFTVAEKIEPCVLFVDEMDSLFRSRSLDDHQVDRNLKTEFMQLWDQLALSGSSVLVIGATNRPQDLDAAIHRRFERSFLIPLPDEAAREEILRINMRELSVDRRMDYMAIAKRTEGYSSSDLKILCKAAAAFPLEEYRSKMIRSHLLPDRRNATSESPRNDSSGGQRLGGVQGGVPNLMNTTNLPKMRPIRPSDFDRALQSVVPVGRMARSYGDYVARGSTPLGPRDGSVDGDTAWIWWTEPTEHKDDDDDDDE